MGIEIIGASVQGASHKRTGKECQDSNKSLKIGDVAIFAAADGHGSESCPFSKSGATIAVNVFCKLMSDYCANYAKDMEALMTYFNRAGETAIARAIDKEWKRRVEKTHKDNKREIPQTESRENDKPGIWRQYGTTLLGLVITPAFYFAFQLGDGDMLLLRQNAAEAIIKSDKILGTETHSLSREEAWKKALSSVGHMPDEKGALAFMIATDGFSNSYSDETAFLQACKDYYAAIQEHGINTVSNNLKSWLDETSENGSGDDITVMFAVVGKEKGKR